MFGLVPVDPECVGKQQKIRCIRQKILIIMRLSSIAVIVPTLYPLYAMNGIGTGWGNQGKTLTVKPSRTRSISSLCQPIDFKLMGNQISMRVWLSRCKKIMNQ